MHCCDDGTTHGSHGSSRELHDCPARILLIHCVVTAIQIVMRSTAAVCFVAIAACSSSTTLPPGIVDPDVAFAQIYGQSALYEIRGPISVPFAMEVMNPSDVPITLDRLQLQSIGTGAYDLNYTVEHLQQVIEPGATEQFTFSAWGFAPGGRLNATSPTTVRVVAHFESPQGRFRKIVTSSVGGIAGSLR